MSTRPTVAPPTTTGIDVAASGATITSMLADDYANRATRANRTQYRISYQAITDGDATSDGFVLDAAGLSVSLVYLAP